MATITASAVKELRELTGAGMMDCKRALSECDGELEAAKDWLRKKGQALADKKAVRKASEGLIHICVSDEGKTAVILELNCETDFVARNEAFLELLKKLGDHIAAGGPGAANNNLEEYLASPSPDDSSKTVRDLLRETVASLSENMELGGFVRIHSEGDGVHFQSYIHPPGKLGVLVELRCSKAETIQNPAFEAYGRDLAMHIAAAAPEFLTPETVSPEAVEREREIFKGQALEAGKPEKIIDKIIEGKLRKYYERICLVKQEFVKNPDESIAQMTARTGKELGDEIEIVRFERFKVGG